MKQGRFFYGWVIVGAGLAVWILEPGMYASFGIFFKPIASELGWSRAMVAGAVSLTSVAMGVLAPFSGALADRYGARRLVMASGILTGVAYALLSTTNALWQFYAFYSVVGLGMGISFAPITTTVIHWFQKSRGLALGITSVGTGIGGMIFPPLANQLISMWGWRNSYLVLGLAMGTAVFLAGTFLRSTPREMGLLPYGIDCAESPAASMNTSHSIARAGSSAGEALRTMAFWAIFFAALAAVFSFSLVNVHMVPYATDQGINPATAAAFMAVFGAGNSIGRLGLGALSDRIGRKRMFVTLLVISGVAMLFLSTARSPWMFYMFALVFGVAYGGAIVNWLTLPGELFGLRAVGVLTGLIMTGSTFGGASGSFLAGYIFDVTGAYSAAFSTGAILLLIAAGAGAFLKLPRRHYQHER
ncbi:MAG: MFS transporter [Dehalococcoidia bacterium]|nr:MFS transporter [Dehalococcoidia bacterium]MDP7469220.1 MFS transporter [Dehalococcoidia bacterium]